MFATMYVGAVQDFEERLTSRRRRSLVAYIRKSKYRHSRPMKQFLISVVAISICDWWNKFVGKAYKMLVSHKSYFNAQLYCLPSIQALQFWNKTTMSHLLPLPLHICSLSGYFRSCLDAVLSSQAILQYLTLQECNSPNAIKNKRYTALEPHSALSCT